MVDKSFIIVVNSISGGGKTTITRALQKTLENSKAIFFDDGDYDVHSGINDICKWVEEGADANEFNLEPLVKKIEIMAGEQVKYIIIDYPFGYRHDLISKYIDYSIYIDTPLDVALARRIIRDYDEQSISNIFDDMQYYIDSARNAYLAGCQLGKENADFIVDGNLPVKEVVDTILEKVKLS